MDELQKRTADLIDRLMATTFDALGNKVGEDDVGVLLGALVSYCGNISSFLAFQAAGPNQTREEILENTRQFLTGISRAFDIFCEEQKKLETGPLEGPSVSSIPHSVSVTLGKDISVPLSKAAKDLLN